MCAASFQPRVKVGENITMKRHAYSWINTKFRTHLRRVHSGHYSDNLCQKLPGRLFPAEIWQITCTGFNWVRAHSQNFVLVLGMRISIKCTRKSQRCGKIYFPLLWYYGDECCPKWDFWVWKLNYCVNHMVPVQYYIGLAIQSISL